MFAEIGDDIMIVTFLSDARNNAKSFKNCALFRLCGKVGPPQSSLASFENKSCCCAAGRRRPFAAAISGADTPKFRKHPYTCASTWKSWAQFPCLTYITKNFLLPLIFPWKIEKCMPISEFHIKILMLEGMIDEE